MTTKTDRLFAPKINLDLKGCPCCGAPAREGTHDYMTWFIECSHRHCGVRVQRGIINTRNLKRCLVMCRRAWEKRVKQIKF